MPTWCLCAIVFVISHWSVELALILINIFFNVQQGFCPGLTHGQKYGITYLASEDASTTPKESTAVQSHSVVVVSDQTIYSPSKSQSDVNDAQTWVRKDQRRVIHLPYEKSCGMWMNHLKLSWLAGMNLKSPGPIPLLPIIYNWWRSITMTNKLWVGSESNFFGHVMWSLELIMTLLLLTNKYSRISQLWTIRQLLIEWVISLIWYECKQEDQAGKVRTLFILQVMLTVWKEI